MSTVFVPAIVRSELETPQPAAKYGSGGGSLHPGAECGAACPCLKTLSSSTTKGLPLASGWGLVKVFAANPESCLCLVMLLSSALWLGENLRANAGDERGLVWSSGAGVSSACLNTAIVGIGGTIHGQDTSTEEQRQQGAVMGLVKKLTNDGISWPQPENTVFRVTTVLYCTLSDCQSNSKPKSQKKKICNGHMQFLFDFYSVGRIRFPVMVPNFLFCPNRR